MSLFDEYFSIHSDASSAAATAAKPRGFLRETTIGASNQVNTMRSYGPLHIKNEEYLEIIKETKAELDFLNEQSVCSICNTTYLRKHNIGRMCCRWHPNPGYGEDTFDCCGKSRTTIGCKPCDHSPIHPGRLPRWSPGSDTEAVPLAVAIYLRIPHNQFTVEAGSTYKRTKALIKRCVY